MHRRRAHHWLIGTAATLLFALPVVAQESLLPPGFDAPPARPAPSPSPAPRPSAPTPAPAPRPSAPTPAPRPTSAAPQPGGPAPRALPGAPGQPMVTADGVMLSPDGVEMAPPAPRYDMPAGSRRSLKRIGPLGPDTGGLPANAFGNRGLYLSVIMDRTRGGPVSRWSQILLRRALLSAVDTPQRISGADFVAARAGLLLRSGESVASRMLVQQVDVDRASPRLKAVLLQSYLANADPGGLCPYTPSMVGSSPTWDLAHAMCTSLVGEAGQAGAIIERVSRRRQAPAIDVKLAEKVVGSGFNANRNAIVRWDGVDRLTSWRFGLAAATGVAIPDALWRQADSAMRGWAVQAPMIEPERRLAVAGDAAKRGILSSRAYVDLVSAASEGDEVPDATADLAEQLRGAFVYADRTDRLDAIHTLSTGSADPYAGMVLVARAAARVSPADLSDDDGWMLLSAMFAGGYDNNAMAWAPNIAVGSQPWGLLAVGSPRPLVGVDAGNIDEFADGDPTTEQRRTRFLAAALIGLGRVEQADAARLASDYSLGLARSTRWTRAISLAAQRGEAGTVALLAAVGLQGRGWDGVPPYHLYHITRALRQVGLGPEARMIAAEALTRAS